MGLTGAPIWAAIGHFGAWVNLFNLLPSWHLDAAHAFASLDRVQRWAVVAATVIIFVVTREGLLVLIGGLGAVQAWTAPDDIAGDRSIAAQLIGLVAVLAGIALFAPSPVLAR